MVWSSGPLQISVSVKPTRAPTPKDILWLSLRNQPLSRGSSIWRLSSKPVCKLYSEVFFNKLYIIFVLSLGRGALFCAWVCVQGCSCAFLCECVCLCAIHAFHRFKERSWWEYFYNRAVLLCLHTRPAPWRRSDWHNELAWAVCTSQHVSTTSQNLNKFTNSHEALVPNVGKLLLLWSTDVI